MLLNLDVSWLLMAFAVVCIVGFMFASALHAIMGEDGFGPFGNMALFVGGFFGAILLANEYGINLSDLKRAVTWGLGGAFVSISLMALLKAAIVRLP